jgi:hypothetical protein
MLERGVSGHLLFPIRGAPERCFYAGHLPDGRQALIAWGFSGQLMVAAFDGDGKLVEVTCRELPDPLTLPESGETVSIYDDEGFQEYLRQDFGFSPGLIRVEEFRIPGEGLAVYHLPRHYQDFLRDPNGPDFGDEERRALPGLIRDWLERGQFVLEEGHNDYWLDSTGEVVAS